MSGYMYILLCSNGSYYVGSTIHLVTRYNQHADGEGAKHTMKFPPLELLYFEKYNRIDLAFDREHQVKRWSRAKKEALIGGRLGDLKDLSECQNASHCKGKSMAELAKKDADMIGDL